MNKVMHIKAKDNTKKGQKRVSLISTVVLDILWYDTERHGYHINCHLKYTSQTLTHALYLMYTVNGDVLKIQ